MAQYEVTLADYWRILRRRKGIVVFTAFLLGFFSFVLATIWQPIPIYSATAKVQLVSSSSQSLASLYLEAYGGGGGELETQMSVITSFPLLKKVIRELGIPAENDTAQVVLDLLASLDIDQEGYASILLVSVDDASPEYAAGLVNGVSRVFVKHSDDDKNQQSTDHLSFVDKQLKDAKRSLREAEEESQRYREENDIVSIEAEASVLLGGITDGDRNKIALEQVLKVIEGMLAEIEEEQQLSLETLQGVGRQQVGATFMVFVQQLHNLRLERDALLVKFTENHPVMRQTQAKVDLLFQNLTGELRQRHHTVNGDLAGVVSQLKMLREKYSYLPARGLELGRREREVYLRQEVVTVLAQEYETARIRAADVVETAKVLQEAIVPTQANNPHNPVQRAVMGLILGMVLGVVFAVVAETLDTSIGTIEDVQEYTDAKVVGEEATSGRLGRVLGVVLLMLSVLGIAWQSGYMQRPLGLVPVYDSYNRVGAMVGGVAVVPVAALEPEQAEARVAEVVVPPESEGDVSVIQIAEEGSGRLAVAEAPAYLNPVTDVIDAPGGRTLPYTLLLTTYKQTSKWAVPNLNKLRQAGQMAFLVPASEQEPNQRLMAGSFANWDAAFQEGHQLREGALISGFTPAHLPFAVELGRFANSEQTLNFLQRLGDRARYSYVQALADGSQRVLAAAFETREEAAAALSQLAGSETQAHVARR